MNEIEQKFWETWLKVRQQLNDYDRNYIKLETQKVVGVYKVDFGFGLFWVEIDGHEHHKTKEQREKDYSRERYLQKEGYYIIRFMGTEVFLDAEKCVWEMVEIMRRYRRILYDFFTQGQKVAANEILTMAEAESKKREPSD